MDAFSTVYDFFEKHYDEVDAVSCRVKRFEARGGYHAFDYKFKKGTRIADLNNPDEYFSIQTLVTPVFIKSEAIKDLRFDTRIICGEDTVFCNKIILEKCKIGFIEETTFNYRKRFADNSVTDKIRYNSFYYNEMFEYYHRGLIDYSTEKFGEVIPYIQAVLAGDLLWRCNEVATHKFLNDEEFGVYRKKLKETFQLIEDSIIFGHPIHKAYTKRAAAVNFKYDIDYYKSLVFKDNQLFFGEFKVFNMLKGKNHCILNSVSAANNKFRIEVLVSKWLLRSTACGGKLVLKVGERFVNPKEQLEYAQKTIRTIDGGEYYYASCIFVLKLKLKDGETVQIAPYLVYGEEISPIRLNYSEFTDGINELKSCRVQGKYIVDYTDGSIQISRYQFAIYILNII